MAIIKCLECAAQISDKTKICPNCGMPLSILKDADYEVNTSRINTIQFANNKPNSERQHLWNYCLFVAIVSIWIIALNVLVLYVLNTLK